VTAWTRGRSGMGISAIEFRQNCRNTESERMWVERRAREREEVGKREGEGDQAFCL